MTGLAWKISGYVRPYTQLLALALVQVFVLLGFELLKPWPLKIVVDNALSGQPIAAGPLTWLAPGIAGWSASGLVAAAVTALVVIYLLSGGLTVVYNAMAIWLGQRMVSDLRARLYAHLQRLSLAYHSRQRVGDLMMRVTADSYAVQTMIMNGALPILQAFVLLIGMICVLAPIDLELTLVSLTIVPILFVLIGLFNRKIAAIATVARDNDSLVYSVAHWGLGSIKLVQAFTKEEDEHRRFMAVSGAALRAHLKLYSWQTLYTAVIGTLMALGTALVIYVGAHEVLSGALSIGTLLVFTTYLGQLYGPVNQITQSWGLIAGARVGAHRCFEILETEADLKDGSRVFPAKGAEGRVEWRDVQFRYRADQSVLRGITLAVEPGQTVALVGATGAGKSTLLGLVPRFFDPSLGSILIDGVDARDYEIRSLRRQVAMVLQPPLVFPLSVRENIAYGRPEASLDEIRAAARLAEIDRLIETLPEGYDTLVGEGGATFSEGEKQRLTIARALLRDAPILILDEPTSALDAETEALVMAGIRRLTQGRTTFVIAHRLSTVRRADVILVLKDGVIAEAGRFDDLMHRSNGLFRQLYDTQFDLTEETHVGV
ncbi:ABC transporter permease [Aliidongia dinghuensis]|uniref:ABC transporter permease n=1 Tax=Aliidongia dinghuensis TaxID=1867774 RepID=A0A8J2YXY0_9PROT|nr:ABC transporter ATP-binding protein [Aliidongia dinghuensis]GGF38467.1 ABC transporter permease [Aliidongia dinghuensis]